MAKPRTTPSPSPSSGTLRRNDRKIYIISTGDAAHGPTAMSEPGRAKTHAVTRGSRKPRGDGALSRNDGKKNKNIIKIILHQMATAH